jgi:proline dehydrogenase
MFRRLLLSLARSERVRNWVVSFPPSKRAARRFVAGETLSEAIAVVQALNGQGLLAILDHLGENTQTREEAVRAAQEYLRILDAIQQDGLRSYISLKLTQMGLDIDEELCFENLRGIVERARQYENFVRIDMESSAYTERTLRIYERLRQSGYTNVGVVIQAYLRRSRGDVKRLMRMGANIRLCKGAYAEPPSVAFPSKRTVNKSFLELLGLLWSPAARKSGTYVAIATHDERIIRWAKEFAQAYKIPKEHFEFQMLYGIRRDLQSSLAQEGYRVRVYVSYGREWYPYFMRRLAERPANLLFLARQFLRG